MHDRDHRLNLLGRVSAELNRTATPHALIGAAAMAVHGVSRATRDLDLLATERSCLDANRWAPLQPAGVGVEVIKGDWSDPLAGVVRFAAPGERPVDLVVGKPGWQAKALERAEPGIVSSVELPVLRASDLILVKLYAGGPQDAWDIIQLLATAAGPRLRGEVGAHIHELPPAAAALWQRIQ